MQRDGDTSADSAQRAWWASVQDEHGVDVTLILANLKLSVEERLHRSDLARRQALWVRQHARRIAEPPVVKRP